MGIINLNRLFNFSFKLVLASFGVVYIQYTCTFSVIICDYQSQSIQTFSMPLFNMCMPCLLVSCSLMLQSHTARQTQEQSRIRKRINKRFCSNYTNCMHNKTTTPTKKPLLQSVCKHFCVQMGVFRLPIALPKTR